MAERSMEEIADGLLQAVVLVRENHVCELCGGQATAAHHVIHRRHKHVRHDPRFSIAVCYTCHLLDDTGEMVGRIMSVKGEEWYYDLKREAQPIRAYDPSANARALRALLREINNLNVIGRRA